MDIVRDHAVAIQLLFFMKSVFQDRSMFVNIVIMKHISLKDFIFNFHSYTQWLVQYRQYTILGGAKFTQFRSTLQILDLQVYKKIHKGLMSDLSLPLYLLLFVSIATGMTKYILAHLCLPAALSQAYK